MFEQVFYFSLPISSPLGTATGSSVWQAVGIVHSTTNTVTVGAVPSSATKIRYNWYANPCGKECYGCAVYVTVTPLGGFSGARDSLPMPPFMGPISDPTTTTTTFPDFGFGDGGTVVVHG